MLIRGLAVLLALGRIAVVAGGLLATTGIEPTRPKTAPTALSVKPLPHRPDPFVPFDRPAPAERKFIAEEVLDFGLPPARPGPEPVRAAAALPRVAAISWNHTGRVRAVLEWEGGGCLVEPGDFVHADWRVLAIDAQHGTVTLRGERETMVVVLMPRASAGGPAAADGNTGGP